MAFMCGFFFDLYNLCSLDSLRRVCHSSCFVRLSSASAYIFTFRVSAFSTAFSFVCFRLVFSICFSIATASFSRVIGETPKKRCCIWKAVNSPLRCTICICMKYLLTSFGMRS